MKIKYAKLMAISGLIIVLNCIVFVNTQKKLKLLLTKT
jgi:hypothetical protein